MTDHLGHEPALAGGNAQGAPSRLNILLIEDNDKDAQLIKDLLDMKRKDSWRMARARELGKALGMLRDQDFDVVVMDLFLPDSIGISTLQKFVAQNAALPVIILANMKDESVAMSAIREGAQDYLVKGQFTADIFIRAVQYAVERKKIDQLRDDLIGYMNHEIASPLGVIKDSLSQVCGGSLGHINARQERFIKMSLAGIDRLINTTDDFLLCTKLELGKIPIKKDWMSFNNVVRDIVETFKVSYRQKGLSLKAHMPFWDIRLMADCERISQVLGNLLNNALKHTVKGGVKVIVRKKGRMAHCIVRDTGPGIDEEHLPKTFQKYQQLVSGNGRPRKGSGLGLYICKALVEQFGGRITVKSRLGMGTEFNFSLPLGI